jgi:hypothetical protein
MPEFNIKKTVTPRAGVTKALDYLRVLYTTTFEGKELEAVILVGNEDDTDYEWAAIRSFNKSVEEIKKNA